MDNNDVRILVETFKGYRDLLTPIQANLSDFIGTYDSIKDDIQRLNDSFGEEVKNNLQGMFKSLSKQAESASEFSQRIDQFVKMAAKYTSEVSYLVGVFNKIEEKISAVNEIERQAEEQIKKLDTILEEKKKSYNIKELQRTLDNYNDNVQRVSEFINKDVVENLNRNNKQLDAILSGNDRLAKQLGEERTTLDRLLVTNIANGDLLQKVTERGDVDEEYLYAVLDKWADARKVRTKK